MESTATAPLPNTTDFPDWLSPMLVKELRQGVRTRVFVSVFILLQVLMLLNLSLSLLVAAHGEDTAAGTAFFWIMVGLPVLVILPMSGLSAVGGETKAGTLELIFLTRLTAFRIVFGKWLANFAQSLLLICAVLPYLVLRYFMGGVNVSTELVTLASILGGSALLTAAATGLSAYPIRFIRPLAGFLGFFFIFFGLQFAVMMISGVGGMSFRAASGPDALQITGLLLCGVIVLALLLEVGAARIAPPAENHSAVMRLLALGALAIALIVGLVERRALGVTMAAFIIAYAVCAVALCETPRWIPGLLRPFATRGTAGRIAGRLLYPGWYTGVVLTVLMFAGFGGLLKYQQAFDKGGHVTRFVAAAGTLLLPVALIHWWGPRTKKAVALFFAVQLLSVIAMIFAAVCDEALKTNFRQIVAFLPLTTLMMTVSDSDADSALRLPAVAITTMASLVVLLLVLRRPMKQTSLAERECLQMPAPPPPPPPVSSSDAPVA